MLSIANCFGVVCRSHNSRPPAKCAPAHASQIKFLYDGFDAWPLLLSVGSPCARLLVEGIRPIEQRGKSASLGLAGRVVAIHCSLSPVVPVVPVHFERDVSDYMHHRGNIGGHRRKVDEGCIVGIVVFGEYSSSAGPHKAQCAPWVMRDGSYEWYAETSASYSLHSPIPYSKVASGGAKGGMSMTVNSALQHAISNGHFTLTSGKESDAKGAAAVRTKVLAQEKVLNARKPKKKKQM